MISNLTSTIQEEKQAQKIPSSADLLINKNMIANTNYFVSDDRNIDDFFNNANGKKGEKIINKGSNSFIN